MSIRSPNSLASNRDPISASDNEPLTSSPPPRESSHDEYSPERPSNAISVTTEFTSPSNRSNTTDNLPSDVRLAINKLYSDIYGEESQWCLVTRSKLSLILAHVVQRASTYDQLTIYEYCLGLEFLTFHVDSRKNLLYFKSDWHTAFDAGKWILLPDSATLVEVHRYVESALAWRGDSTSARVEDFTTKWPLHSKTRYKLIPLPSMELEPFLRQADGGRWFSHDHPYRDLPELECHIAPPYVVINAGPKCVGLDLDQVALDYHESETSDSQRELKRQLQLLCNIWALFENAKEAANAWGVKEREERRKRKRKRDEDDVDTSSLTTKRTTRSQTRTVNSGHDSPPSPSQPGSRASRQPGGSNTNRQSSRVARKRKRKWGSSTSTSGATLTETAVWHLCKRQKMTDPNTMITRWVESTYG